MKQILRVFPSKTSYTPDDDLVRIGFLHSTSPNTMKYIYLALSLGIKKYCEELAFQWEVRTNKPVKLGGVASIHQSKDFIQGLYLKSKHYIHLQEVAIITVRGVLYQN